MKPLNIGMPNEALWFTHIGGIYHRQKRDSGRLSEDLMHEYGSETHQQHGGEG